MKLSVEGKSELILEEGASVTIQGPCTVLIRPLKGKKSSEETWQGVKELVGVGPEYRKYPDGTEEWYLNGKRHRPDGPAIKVLDGCEEWWLNGKNYSEAQFNKLQGIKKATTKRGSK